MGKGRLVVTYSDGSWTDDLCIAQYGMENAGEGLTLTIEVQPRERPGKVRAAQAALRELASNRLAIQTIQVAEKRFRARLNEKLRGLDSRRFELRLRAAGTAIDYPAWAVFGPDEITLNLG